MNHTDHATADRAKWDALYASRPSARTDPAPWLASLDDVLPRTGRALDVAGGDGRNALWLARRGLSVTLADFSAVALRLASETAAREGLSLETLETDLERGPLPPGPWDVAVVVDFLWRPVFADLAGSLAPGGWLVVAHPTASNLLRHPKPGAHHLLGDGELPGLAVGLEVIRYEEGWQENGRHEARLLARRPGGRG